jgi:putative DNA primase/helicase
MPALFYEDASPEALAQEMAAGWPSAALWSDEGALVVGSRGMSSDDSALRYFGLLNRFWDGNNFERFRTTAKSFTVIGRRLSCSLMMQHIVLCQVVGAAGGVARGTGFLARFLLAWPRSTMGTRDYRECAPDGPALSNWDDRVTSLLSLPLPVDPKTMALDPPLLNFSGHARLRWIEFHNDAEHELGQLQEFGDVADFAAKAAENAARIAGVFWVFEHGLSGEIDAETMEAGAAIAFWHLHEAKRILGATKVPQAVSDAALLAQWMQKPEPNGKERWKVSPRDILREGPARLRDKERRDAAAKILVATKHIFEVQEPRGTLWVLNPKLREKSGAIGP